MNAGYVMDRPYRKIPIVTAIIFALNLIGLIYEYAVGENAAIYRFAMYQGALQDGEWIRIFVSAFLHYGIFHFGSNMVCLVVFGLDLENRIDSPQALSRSSSTHTAISSSLYAFISSKSFKASAAIS